MPRWEVRHRDAVGVIALCGDWLTSSETPAPEITRVCHSETVRQIEFDVSRLGRWDTTLVAFLWEIKQVAAASGVILDDSALPPSARQLVGLLPSEPAKPQSPAPRRFQPLSWALDKAVTLLTEVGESVVLTAATATGSMRLLLGRARCRGADLVSDLLDAGPRAVAIVGTINFLVGAILAFIGTAELGPFAAQLFVTSLVGVTSVRELASIVTAIVMAGRTGGSYAARIASMQGSEEIAALRVLGVPITDFLVLPSVVSLCLTMPILYLLGCFFAILGGLTVATISLDFTAHRYFRETFDAIPLGDFVFGAAKSIIFAALIGMLSCRVGLKAARSARAVGDAATSAVVANITGIIALDALFAVIMQARGS
jgi:phospholipid/cholesterol/gamma-HCH transport system permease protein